MNSVEAISLIAQLDSQVIYHPAFEKARRGLNICMEKSKVYRAPVGSLLLAESGMGKSTLCKTLIKAFPQSIVTDKLSEKKIITVLYIEVPAPTTVKSVAEEFLYRMGDPNPSAGTAADKTRRICRLLQECNTQLVLMDEVQNLFALPERGPKKLRYKHSKTNDVVCSWIKYLVNSTTASFCLVGLPDFGPILLMDNQLSRRFPYHYVLPPLNRAYGSPDGSMGTFFKKVMANVQEKTSLAPIDIFSSHALDQIYAATGGSPSYVMALIKDAALIALAEDSKQLDNSYLAKAWDMGSLLACSLTTNNPFHMTAGELALALKVKHGG